jgi:hypothetical protein
VDGGNKTIRAQPDISAEAKNRGTSAKAPWEAVLMMSRPLNSLFASIIDTIILLHFATKCIMFATNNWR